jgi:hypothetical protein
VAAGVDDARCTYYSMQVDTNVYVGRCGIRNTPATKMFGFEQLGP